MDSYKPTYSFRKLLSTLPKKRIAFYQDIQDEYHLIEINKSEEYFIYLDLNQDGTTKEYKVSFNQKLKRELENSLQLYKNDINEIFQRNDFDEEHFFTVHKNILDEIKFQYVREILKYPLIEEFLKRAEMHLLNLTQPEIDHFLNDTSFLTTDQKIRAIFSYLKGENAEGEKIMSDEDYSRLVNMIYQLVEKKVVPKVEKPIDEIGINRELLRFTFYVLYREHNTSKLQRTNILHFLKEVFVAFENYSVKSLDSSFARKSKIYHSSFIPPIIKKYLE